MYNLSCVDELYSTEWESLTSLLMDVYATTLSIVPATVEGASLRQALCTAGAQVSCEGVSEVRKQLGEGLNMRGHVISNERETVHTTHMDSAGHTIGVAETVNAYSTIDAALSSSTIIPLKSHSKNGICVLNSCVEYIRTQRLKNIGKQIKKVSADMNFNISIETDISRSCLQLLCNLLYGCPFNQTLLRETGGLLEVLSLSATDVLHPLRREWALLCTRNACADNSENQLVIEELTLQKVTVVNEQLKESGLTVDFNPTTGKMQFMNQKPI